MPDFLKRRRDIEVWTTSPGIFYAGWSVKPLTFISLFAGIGGFDLGLERAGMKCIAQVEIDPFCRAVLAKHWPDVVRYQDVTKFCRRCYDCDPETPDGEVFCRRCNMEFGDCDCVGTDAFVDEYGTPDLICGGFPCQDISNAGKRAGINGERSGLWAEYARIICELRPRYIIVENVAALLERGIGRVLGDLAALGFDAEWHCIPASFVGAPHIRDRVWIVAYTDQSRSDFGEYITRQLRAQRQPRVWEPFRATDFRLRVQELARVCRADDGIPEELGAYGNAVVPQVAEVIGRAIVAAHKEFA